MKKILMINIVACLVFILAGCSYDELPPEYQYNNETGFQPNWIRFLDSKHEEVYFEAKYWIDCDGITKDFCIFYKVDKDGNITELRNEDEI